MSCLHVNGRPRLLPLVHLREESTRRTQPSPNPFQVKLREGEGLSWMQSKGGLDSGLCSGHPTVPPMEGLYRDEKGTGIGSPLLGGLSPQGQGQEMPKGDEKESFRYRENLVGRALPPGAWGWPVGDKRLNIQTVASHI